MRRILCVGMLWSCLAGVLSVVVPATTSAVVSSNGLIAFISARSGGDAVWVMHVDGSGQTRVTRTVDPGFPAFSPNGRRIAYLCGNFDICVMNAYGSDRVRVTTNGWSREPVVDSVPTWSSDGTRIAFDRAENGRDDLYVVSVDGTGLRRLTNGVYDEDAAWSLDGNQIAFDGIDRAGNNQIFVVNDRRQLTASSSPYSEAPSWSPGGQRIAYARLRLPFGAYHLWVMKADGTANRQLTSGPWNQESPAWSPDGEWIAYSSDESYQQNIWVMSAAGTGQVQLTHGAGFNISPSWQPVPSSSPGTPLPAVSTRRPSRPTPEARAVAILFRAENVLYDDVAASTSPIGALTIGRRLISDSARARGQTLAVLPPTAWGKKFRRTALAMYASARAAGTKFDAAIVDAAEGRTGLARADVRAASKDLLTMFIQQGQLDAEP